MRRLRRLFLVVVFLSLAAFGGAFRQASAIGGLCRGDCWTVFECCHTACNGNSQCELGCECTYCACAGLLCPQECSIGQN
jgi:hypothetical protein